MVVAKITRLIQASVLFVFLANSINAEGQIVDRKTLPLPISNFDLHYIDRMDLFTDDDRHVSIRINNYVWVHNNWIDMSKKGWLLNGFIRDGQLYMSAKHGNNLNVCQICSEVELDRCIKIKKAPSKFWISPKFTHLFETSSQDKVCYLLGRCQRFPSNIFDLTATLASGGHGIYYTKPFFVKIKENKMSSYIKFDYGGRTDESLVVKEAVAGKNSIHLLGLRKQGEPGTPLGKDDYLPQPVIMYYVNFDLEKNKYTRKHCIYEDTPRLDKTIDSKFFYGPPSMDNQNDDIFVVFPWTEIKHQSKRIQYSGKNPIQSDIYFWEYSGNSAGNVNKIAEGFCPLVRCDLLDNVHVIWIGKNRDMIHRVRKSGIWSQERIILNDVDDLSGGIASRAYTAEFDKDGCLHIVYISGNKITRVKIDMNQSGDL